MNERWSQRLVRILTGLLILLGILLCGKGGWIHAKALLAQLLLRQAWEQTLRRGEPVNPWPWADTWPVARLRVQKYNQDIMVLAGQSGEALAFGPGILEAGAEPGQAGTCILAAHRDTHFSFLHKVRAGDIFTLEDRHGKSWQYRVSSTAVRRAEDLYLEQQTTAQLALITCYPFQAVHPGTQQRYLVMADRM
ncbi:MAG: class GN sortase [Candidatus Electrothrix sp. AR4]|nr:class GN sortase [Candidatus Electrothrix sp. AR4]